MLKRKSKVTWKDVEEVLVSVLSHRIKLKPSSQYLQTPQEFVTEKIREFVEQQGLGDEAEGGEGP
jgi:hypothetical protein